MARKSPQPKATSSEVLEHRFSNRGTKEKSAQSEVNKGRENRVNAYQLMLIATSKP
jgi:hypothetical protein